MEIQKGETPSGSPYIEFEDYRGSTCRLTGDAPLLKCKFGSHTVFTQEQVKSLLPYLQSFAETGQLEEAPQESTLQGGTLAEAFQLENLLKVSAEQNLKIYELEKQIKALEQLVKEWREFAFPIDYPSSCCDDLQEKTAQLLGE